MPSYHQHHVLEPPFELYEPPFELYEPLQKAPSPIIIDSFSPRSLNSYDLSPASSISSVSTDFEVARSRAVRVYGDPSAITIGEPSFWQGEHGELWAVFISHQEASNALQFLNSSLYQPAKESDLEPFARLKRVDIKEMFPHQLSSNPPNPRSTFRLGDWICTHPKCGAHNFGRNLACIGCGSPRSTQSPPTSTTSPATQHTSVSSLQAQSSASNPGLMASMHAFGGMSQPQSPVTVRPSASPRFVSAPNLVPSPAPVPQRSTTSFGVVGGFNLNNLTTTRGDPTLRTASGHPLLTPSGRAFAVGGRVQNISLDPLSPCVMYWPDNEPFPEQGQIRPSNLAGVAHPPILNTGNRGPIAHQPGDWICKKCNYLNWRRRKVCQTCLPYAEGNGDSISAAVQAERIQLLTNVLLQNPTQQPPIQQPAPTQREENRAALLQQLSLRVPSLSTPTLPTNIPPRHQQQHQLQNQPPLSAPLANMHTMRQMQAQALRSHSVTPPQVRDRMLEVHRARSQHDLLGSISSGPREDPSPIYQTSGGRPSGMSVEERRDQLELSSLNAHMSSLNLWGTGTSPTPPSLLPSFLQEIVSSPTTSEHDLPAATSSSPPRTRNDRSRSSTNSSTSSGLESLEVRSIWKLDGEESKLFGSSQAGSRGGSRRGSPTMGK